MELCNSDSEVCITATSMAFSATPSRRQPASDKPKKTRHRRSDTGRKHDVRPRPDQPLSDTGSKHDMRPDQPGGPRSDTGRKHHMSDQPRSDTGSKHKRRKIQAPKPTAAQTYGEKYHSELRFLTCACCAFEGPRSGFKSLSSLKERGCLNWHGHSKRTIVQTLMGSSFQYDRHYGMALHTGLDEYGMLPGLKVPVS